MTEDPKPDHPNVYRLWPISPCAAAAAGSPLCTVTGTLGPGRGDSANTDVLSRHLDDWRRLESAARERGDVARADELARVVSDYETEVAARTEATNGDLRHQGGG
ncbi:MAG: hypothetical protein AVDCRST_MAG34-1815 [uncultured Nocardioidaceae bacterium]|uniref:Uncharacterized protein n=1 Tax=uncultured Nocardioidaceae bacterium TaxID=253824 RepID=A0A6J4M7E2_9ACTN|nr:MAG: hypothetical protein AVDCRST_MAG34-1815 [uncultured Nocardioidaceae bacterium]